MPIVLVTIIQFAVCTLFIPVESCLSFNLWKLNFLQSRHAGTYVFDHIVCDHFRRVLLTMEDYRDTTQANTFIHSIAEKLLNKMLNLFNLQLNTQVGE